MKIAIDEAEWPLVTVRWTGRISDDELAAFIAHLDAWLGRGERFGMLIDSRGALGFSSDQRRRVVAHMKAARPKTERSLVQALVHDNAIQRTLSLVIEIVVPPPFPTKTFGDLDAARAWLRAQLDVRPAEPE